MTIRAVIVEDEPLARQTIVDFAADEPDLEIVGQAADGLEAIAVIDREKPDLVFLDVQLPELTGLQVLERISHRPRIIFATAFDRYAVPAFELHALDYLLKPFGRERFRAALARIRETDLAPVRLEQVRAALGTERLTRLFLRRRDVIVPVSIDEVTQFVAAGDYVEVHAGGTSYLASCRLVDLEARLDPERFLRIHRSHLVNLDQIVSLSSHDERRLVVILRDGTRVTASRTGSLELRRRVM
jgi:two-component system, LytTR family, response regulator